MMNSLSYLDCSNMEIRNKSRSISWRGYSNMGKHSTRSSNSLQDCNSMERLYMISKSR
jgi:hypothetical protein